MARAIAVIEEFIKGLAQGDLHSKLVHKMAAVTGIQGGQQINVIPDRCETKVDWRILPGRNADSCRNEIAELLSTKLDDEIKVELLNQ